MYSSDPCYAKPYDDEFGQWQFMFQLRQRPGSYGIGQETMGGQIVDPLVPRTRIEWYTAEDVAIVITGLLVRFRPKPISPPASAAPPREARYVSVASSPCLASPKSTPPMHPAADSG